MQGDLDARIRQVVDAVPAVTAAEVRSRVELAPPGVRQGRRFAWGALATIGVAATVTLGVLAPWSGPDSTSTSESHVLGPAATRLVVDASSSAMTSGKAHMDVTERVGGTTADRWSVDMAFSGADLSEAVTWTNYPVTTSGATLVGPQPTTSTSEMALVDGRIYRQLSGNWYTESQAAAPDILVAPQPRQFLDQISPSAQLTSLGSEQTAAGTVTHFRAANPSAVTVGGLVLGLAGGPVTSFDVWVDSANVVQRITWTISAGSPKVCASGVPQANESSGTQCTSSAPETETVEMTFAALGVPQSIVAPAGARAGSGPFDTP